MTSYRQEKVVFTSLPKSDKVSDRIFGRIHKYGKDPRNIRRPTFNPSVKLFSDLNFSNVCDHNPPTLQTDGRSDEILIAI